jgi:hypothetical protein
MKRALTLAWVMLGWSGAAMAHAPGTLLILPVSLTDTSGEVRDQAADHARRRALVASEAAASLPTGGAWRADILSQAVLDAACPGADSECVLRLARNRGAARILLVEAFKTSTLILEARMSLIDAGENKALLRRFVSFRGDTDDSWRRLGRFLGQQVVGITD